MWQGFATSAFGGQTCGMLVGHMASALGMLQAGQDHRSMGLQVGVVGVLLLLGPSSAAGDDM